MNGRQGRSRVAQANGTDSGDERRGADVFDKADAMIAGIRINQQRELPRCRPIEGPSINDDSSHGGAVASDELGGGMDHDVRPVFKGAHQIGRGKGAVDYQGDPVRVGCLGDRLDVDDV